MPKFWQKSCPTYVGNPWKSFKVRRKSFQNQPKTDPNREKCVLGAFSAPSRGQVGSRSAPGRRQCDQKSFFRLKMSFQGSILWPLEIWKSLQNRTFVYRQALGPSKNGFRKGVRKKHENLMKNRCENGRFLMARNHVWRYTLRLFHTFAIFEKSWKIDAKREAKSQAFWSKVEPWTPQGRLIGPFWSILGGSKNRHLFRCRSGSSKNP